ncbi:MAG TPA: SusC/RagA family TonB-linked outer membrane protein [Gemmatimonadaceae bacterium]|nr:SusC/RagA family TonB-linked outer membrane protein [Gemmatimonadaceae bacterium]
MTARWIRAGVASSALVLCAAMPTRVVAQSTIQGRVTAQDGEPLQQANVLLVGTALTTVTGQDGRYSLRNVPAGSHTVRVLRVGYREQKKLANVSDGTPFTLDFALERTVVQLEEIVSTATGSRPREELGNAVATINATKVLETVPISNLADVLAARVPGVTVAAGSQVGGGARIRIRGNSSLNLSNDPIYIIDGMRMTSNQGSMSNGTGGAQASRVNDLNPDEIENIEIVKGPSAATLYGTDAANGVVVITTKRGRAGATRWNAWAEGGLLRDYTDYPLNYTLTGHAPGSTTPIEAAQCTLSRVAAGTCIVDSLRTYAPTHDPDATPLSWGYRNQLGMSAAGGTDAVRYFLSAEREAETSVIKLPEFEQRRYAATGIPLRDYNMRPNALDKYSVRANLNASPLSNLDFALSTGFINSDTRFMLESNATAGLGSQLFGGKGYRQNGNISGLEAGTPTSPLSGYRAWTPGYTFQELNQQRVTRTLVSGTADWRPLAWMQNRATVGVDYTSRYDYAMNRRGEGTPVSSTNRLGNAFDDRTAIRNLSFDLGSSSTWRPLTSMSVRSTVGAQYVNYYLEQNNADGSQLAPGTVTPNSGTVLAPTSAATYQKTLGGFVEEQIGWNDRLFVTGAVRTDQNSAFGTKFQRAVYPKLSASWIVSDEQFFPSATWLDQLRLRMAYGKSGVQPGPNDALKTFDGALTSYRAQDAPSVIYTAVGNQFLRPEKTAEIEAGFDLRLLRRANAEITYYSKHTEDALISATIPPSAGAAVNVRRNLGSVTNKGFELLVNGQILDRSFLGVDLAVSVARNDNKLVKLGVDESGKPLPPVINTEWRAQAGYPLFGFWARPILGWDDKDKNGILTYNANPALNEVFVGTDTVFRGNSSPRTTAVVTPGVELFRRRLRISSLFEYKGGWLHYNNTERIRCASRVNCNALENPAASFEEQAMAVAHLELPLSSRTLDGFFQDGTFTRWRELSVSYTMPNQFVARYMRANNGSISLSARNLHVWTEYRGLDPDIDRLAGTSAAAAGAPPNAPTDEFQTMGIPTYFVVRFNLGF